LLMRNGLYRMGRAALIVNGRPRAEHYHILARPEIVVYLPAKDRRR
jgi:hypothetical protein